MTLRDCAILVAALLIGAACGIAAVFILGTTP